MADTDRAGCRPASLADRRCQCGRDARPAGSVPFLAASAVAIIAALSFWLGMSVALTPKSGNLAPPEASVALPPASSPAEPELSQPECLRSSPCVAPPPVALPGPETGSHRSAAGKACGKERPPTFTGANPNAVNAGSSRTKAAYGHERKKDMPAPGNRQGCPVEWSALAPIPASRRARRPGLGSPNCLRPSSSLPAVVTDLPVQERPCLLLAADRNHFTGPFRSALPADEGDQAKLRGRRFGGSAEG